MCQNISNYIGIVILGIGEILFARITLNQKIEINKFKAILTFILTTILCTVIYMFSSGIVKTLLIFVVHMLEFKILFKLNCLKSIFLTFLYIVLLSIIDILLLLAATNILGISKTYCYKNFAGSIIGNLLVCIIFVVLTLMLKKILRKLINERLENNNKIILFSILSFICICMFFYEIIKTFRFSNNIILYLIAIVVLITILFSFIKQTIVNNKLIKEYDKLLEFMVTYENEIEKQRILRHEVKNEFRTIRAKICDKQKEQEIIEYIDEIVNDKYKVKQEEYARFGYLPPNGIKGLCYFKVQEAEEKGIKVALNISKRIKESTVYHLNVKQQRDFGRILGVFLDNAIEASLESEKKKLGIEAYINKEKELQMIISNSFNNKIDKEKIGKETFTTKGRNRGHGLLLVKHITEENKIFERKTEIRNDIYVQTIVIRKKL